MLLHIAPLGSSPLGSSSLTILNTHVSTLSTIDTLTQICTLICDLAFSFALTLVFKLPHSHIHESPVRIQYFDVFLNSFKNSITLIPDNSQNASTAGILLTKESN